MFWLNAHKILAFNAQFVLLYQTLIAYFHLLDLMKFSNDVLDFLSLWVKQIRSHLPKNHILNHSTHCSIPNGF